MVRFSRSVGIWRAVVAMATTSAETQISSNAISFT